VADHSDDVICGGSPPEHLGRSQPRRVRVGRPRRPFLIQRWGRLHVYPSTYLRGLVLRGPFAGPMAQLSAPAATKDNEHSADRQAAG
jgi:hypothetical protein